jgi:hypothetical protein
MQVTIELRHEIHMSKLKTLGVSSCFLALVLCSFLLLSQCVFVHLASSQEFLAPQVIFCSIAETVEQNETNTFYGWVRDQNVGTPFSNCNIGLYLRSQEEVFAVLESVTRTDSNGQFVFARNMTDPYGIYYFTVVADCNGQNVSSAAKRVAVSDHTVPMSNSNLTQDPVFMGDEITNETLIILANGTLRNKKPYFYNSWLVYGFGTNQNNQNLTFNGGMRLDSTNYLLMTLNETPIRVESEQTVVQLDLNQEFPLPTVFSKSNSVLTYRSFDYPNYQFVFSSSNVAMVMNVTAAQNPFYLSRNPDEMIALSGSNGTLEVWGGYVVPSRFNASVTYNGHVSIFEGFVCMDREWHAYSFNVIDPPNTKRFYVALAGMQPDFSFALWESGHTETGQIWSRQGRVRVSGLDYLFDNFAISSSGGLFPEYFYVAGVTNSGIVINMTGVVLNRHGSQYVSQPFLQWSGLVIKPGGETVQINAYGAGEYIPLEHPIVGSFSLTNTLASLLSVGVFLCILSSKTRKIKVIEGARAGYERVRECNFSRRAGINRHTNPCWLTLGWLLSPNECWSILLALRCCPSNCNWTRYIHSAVYLLSICSEKYMRKPTQIIGTDHGTRVYIAL